MPGEPYPLSDAEHEELFGHDSKEVGKLEDLFEGVNTKINDEHRECDPPCRDFAIVNDFENRLRESFPKKLRESFPVLTEGFPLLGEAVNKPMELVDIPVLGEERKKLRRAVRAQRAPRGCRSSIRAPPQRPRSLTSDPWLV